MATLGTKISCGKNLRTVKEAYFNKFLGNFLGAIYGKRQRSGDLFQLLKLVAGEASSKLMVSNQ